LFLALIGVLALTWLTREDVRGRARAVPADTTGSGSDKPSETSCNARVMGQSDDTDDRDPNWGEHSHPAAMMIRVGGGPRAHQVLKPLGSLARPKLQSRTTEGEASIARAIRAIAECQERYQTVRDYTCIFSKRERIETQLTPLHVMAMKVRADPPSVYLRFLQPCAGREAIYIAGRHNGKVLAHDVGLNKLLAGTLRLEPTCTRAMEDCRHPITEAGLGPLLNTLSQRWGSELNAGESIVAFRDSQPVDSRPCLLIETTHPRQQSNFLFYRVRVYIDRDLGLPIRFEAYDWPKSAQSELALEEEYTYTDLKLNVGLRDIDFDVSNANYSFGRF
jgi:hypothetical protein